MAKEYKVPEDYDYATGGFLKKNKRGDIIPGQLTPNTLNHILFGVPIREDNPNHPQNVRRYKRNKHKE